MSNKISVKLFENSSSAIFSSLHNYLHMKPTNNTFLISVRLLCREFGLTQVQEWFCRVKIKKYCLGNSNTYGQVWTHKHLENTLFQLGVVTVIALSVIPYCVYAVAWEQEIPNKKCKVVTTCWLLVTTKSNK